MNTIDVVGISEFPKSAVNLAFVAYLINFLSCAKIENYVLHSVLVHTNDTSYSIQRNIKLKLQTYQLHI